MLIQDSHAQTLLRGVQPKERPVKSRAMAPLIARKLAPTKGNDCHLNNNHIICMMTFLITYEAY